MIVTDAGSDASYTLTVDAPELGDLRRLITDRGLDPDAWVVISTTFKEWDSALADGGSQRLQLWSVTLRRAPSVLLASPAQHIPRIEPRKPSQRLTESPRTIVVAADQHCPMHDVILHDLFLDALTYFRRTTNFTDLVLLGDIMDLSAVSRHPDSPAAMQSVQVNLNSAYRTLRDYREAAPDTRCRLILGNHDIRIQSYLMQRAERAYDIKPADDGTEQLEALSIRNLLHLDALGVELVNSDLGWQHSEIDIVPGKLVGRHGWLAGQRNALRSLQARGQSVIFGHVHRREHCFHWNSSLNEEQQGVCIGAMCQTRSPVYPSYTAGLEAWTQGFAVITAFPDDTFTVDHAIYDSQTQTLRWRDQQWH